MKKASTRKHNPDLLEEYDFSKGVRGKYAAGSNVIVLPPDLTHAFPTPGAVHDALRSLMSLAQKTAVKPSRPRRKN